VKLSTKDLHIMLLSICYFREKRRKKGRTFLAELNEITFMHVRV